MKYQNLGNSGLKVPRVIAGQWRAAKISEQENEALLMGALDAGIRYFDHADVYGRGLSETMFGKALKNLSQVKREDIIIQDKIGIKRPREIFDFSKEYLIKALDGCLSRLQTDYIDVLLLHRPDALMEPEEVAEAFDYMEQSGKVRYFGVSNQKPSQIELLKKYVRQPLHVNQLQLSLPVSNLIANGFEVNTLTPGSIDHDDSALDYCRLHDMTIQTWSPFQKPYNSGTFIESEEYKELNQVLSEVAEKYHVTPTGIAAAWILRHPAKMQLIAGTTKPERLKEIVAGADITLTREEWYKLYLAAGHTLP